RLGCQKACVLPENPASYRVVRTKSYLFNKAGLGRSLPAIRKKSTFQDEKWLRKPYLLADFYAQEAACSLFQSTPSCTIPRQITAI
ncbi:hypothetical protein ACVQIK_24100, partial [Klebsiella pneumoniae]